MSTLLNFSLTMLLFTLLTLRENAAYPYSYNIPMSNRADVANTATTPQLISKLLVQSPALDNVYMDYLVTSKPLNLRKYNNKTKKTKKDSKIYFIPIPPLPYRYIPGIGYDYQPMKIKPIVQESTTEKPHHGNGNRITVPTTGIPSTPMPAQSKLFHVQHHKEYYFNGRPFRLQAAHAGRKSSLTPLNLKSRFYYNKNIIY
ncbi:uncharacterized protein LOC117791399 [Drosophila innubila]|uniref:uncharacterized protein LOC117791399 n=1 Tax=Drosophila innubila TaxID=198719 RepID=UPI00148C8948|nr:uncharacterized protein LOC117791399 [Drosophila innubila]